MKRITDKMRLDWFSENGGYLCSGPAQSWTCGKDGCWHDTIREAIDAAIAASKRGRGKRG